MSSQGFASDLTMQYRLLDHKAATDVLRAVTYRTSVQQWAIARRAEELFALISVTGLQELAAEGHALAVHDRIA